MDAGSLSLLYRLASMGAYSLLQYVGQSYPWSAEKSLGLRTQILTMASEERESAAELVRVLQKKRLGLRIMPGGFPSHFTSGNFVSIDYLLPKLIAEHEKEVAQIERELAKVADEEAGKLAWAYLDMKRRHLQVLKESAANKAV